MKGNEMEAGRPVGGCYIIQVRQSERTRMMSRKRLDC